MPNHPVMPKRQTVSHGLLKLTVSLNMLHYALGRAAREIVGTRTRGVAFVRHSLERSGAQVVPLSALEQNRNKLTPVRSSFNPTARPLPPIEHVPASHLVRLYVLRSGQFRTNM
jgi:hypothetical protein